MEIEFILPDIGEGIIECELLEWLVSEGDMIEEDQPVAEVMTDKATVQIPAMHAGIVKSLHYKEGDIAKVHEPLFSLEPTDPVSDSNASLNADNARVVEQKSTSQPQPNSPATTHIEDFILPDIGEGIVECEIVKWNVKEGDRIEEDQSVVEVMTDKAVVEIPAKHSGIVHTLYYKQGDIAKVHSPLFALSSTENANTEKGASDAQVVVSEKETTVAKVSQSTQAQLANKWQDGSVEPPVEIPGRVLASPAVRRIARENNIDLTQVSSSGKKGRILKQDVAQLIAQQASETVSQYAMEHTSEQSPEFSDSHPFNRESKASNQRTVKVRGVQAAMAKQMVASVSTIPHFMVSDEVYMNNLIALREKLKPEFEAHGVKLSFMPFFIKAMSLALLKYPIINSQLNDDGSELTYFDDHNIGFAVDTKLGLMVPNIKRVQSLSLFEIAQQMQEIISQAREGKISSATLKGGTISISNIGAIGGITATPVINKPEAAIVALGKTQKLPRFNVKGKVEAHHIMTVNWSGDHRIIDGATMVRFNNLWTSYLTDPESMLMHLK